MLEAPCRRVCKFSITSDDITIADCLFLSFCKKTVLLFGQESATPNMHMHCHLMSCIKEFGPAHSFWLFPFERYNGILEAQPTNNRSIELQLMRRFLKDNLHLRLHHDAKSWEGAEHFLKALPDTPYESSSPVNFDTETKPGHRSVLGSLRNEECQILRKYYAKLYPQHADLFVGGTIMLSSTFRKYPTVTWQGKTLHSKYNKNTENPFVFASPPFLFTSSNPTEFDGELRPAEIQYFLIHSVILPNSEEPVSHLLACANWPMVHPHRFHFGKPVEVWCYNLHEPCCANTFILVSGVKSRVIVCAEKLQCSGQEKVHIFMPLVE